MLSGLEELLLLLLLLSDPETCRKSGIPFNVICVTRSKPTITTQALSALAKRLDIKYENTYESSTHQLYLVIKVKHVDDFFSFQVVLYYGIWKRLN